MATEVLKLVSGWGEPLIGRLVIGDARMGKWNVVDYSARAAAPKTHPVTKTCTARLVNAKENNRE
ncbi:hypothetical protein [uncultured Mobiluncus sp.]|uniref:hypothetical protein n=1 Tax=uncultured Mobiluncus sp. TaxID=293425 RepID=UPI002889DCE6|nr:hypothetical protein [uncultured Mobiluncus sp.]